MRQQIGLVARRNLADDSLLYSSFVGGHYCVLSMNVDTAARSLAENIEAVEAQDGRAPR